MSPKESWGLVKAAELDSGFWEVRMENEAHRVLSMPGVGLLGMLVIGTLAGSFVGGSLLEFQYDGWLSNLIVATIGAILLLWVWRRFRGPA
jgi:uncharacterized membrane protein YeaQ/YmgE (transglycosylase-associated protein family)